MLSNTVLGLKNKTEITKGILGCPGGSDGKESACNAGDLGLIPGLERSPGEGKGYVLQYSGLESSMDLFCSPLSCKELDTSDFQKHFKKEQEQGL